MENVYQIVLAVISVLSPVCSIVFGYVAFARTKKKDTKDEVAEHEKISSDIHYIKKSLERLENGVNELKHTYTEFEQRLTKIETRVDNLEKFHIRVVRSNQNAD